MRSELSSRQKEEKRHTSKLRKKVEEEREAKRELVEEYKF